MANLPDGKTLGMGSNYGKFRAIAGQTIKRPADTPSQPPMKQRKGQTSLHKGIVGIASQKVKLTGQDSKPLSPPYKGDKDREPKLIETARKRFQMCEEAYSQVRKDFSDDLKFRAGEQWDAGIKNQRANDSRPCLTLNQIPQFVREVTNEQRQNRPGIKVNPVDGEADVDTANVLQGLFRHIEYDSGADAAYDTAFAYAAIGGFGHWYVTTEYSDPMSFDQDIKIKRIIDPLSVMIDPYAVEPDRSDMKFAFMNISRYTKDEFKKKWPEAKAANSDNLWTSSADMGWMAEDEIRVVDYYWKDTKKEIICQLNDGSVTLKKTLQHAFPDETIGKGAIIVHPEIGAITVLNERETEVETVRWAKINGSEVLEETEWAGRYIPIITVLGDELIVDGELVLEGVVRFAKDPQRQYNYMASATTEAIGLAPKAPWVAAEGQIEGYEEIWQNANRMNFSVLPYKQIDLAGKPAPPPQRQAFEPAIQATTMAMMQAANDLRSVTGVQSAALGERSNEKSGIAIRERANQSQSSNYHYGDNLTRALRYEGRILLDLAPHIYDAERTVRIIGEDDVQTTAQLGKPQDLQRNAQLAKVERIYNIGVGKYDVTISTGPNYQTKRQEAVDTQLELLKIDPQLMPVIGDILVGNMDIPGAEEIAERLKKMLPPQLQEDQGGQGEIPPQAQQALAQLTEQNQKLSQELHGALDDLEQKKSEKAMELESKERIALAQIAADEQRNEIEWAKVQASITTGIAKANAQEASEMAAREYDFINSELDRHHEAAMNAMDHQQGLEAQDVAHQQGLESQQQMAEMHPEPADATA